VKKLGTILGMLILVTGLASAGTVTLKLTDFGPHAPEGGPNTSAGVYTYPYYFTITVGANNYTEVPLLCDSYDNEVWQNETWQANEYSISSVVAGTDSGLFGSGNTYKEAAYYFSKIIANPTSANAVDYNWLIWGLFSASAASNSTYQSIYNNFQTNNLLVNPADLTAFNDAGYVLYVPIRDTQSQGGVPQEYLGYSGPGGGSPGPPPPTPEPASLALLASGLVAVAVKFRK